MRGCTPGGGGEANPTEYVLLQVYEPHTARGESEQSGSNTGATRPTHPTHI
ncbi:hypothetical protein DSECCO2_47740 [anaerobic digester metagenome]|jgi:hypothetical protein